MKKIIAFVMRRIISLTALILVLAMLSGCGIGYELLKACYKYEGQAPIIKENWGITIPSDSEELYYGMLSSFLGDGPRYTVLEYSDNKKLENAFDWKIPDEEDVNEALNEIRDLNDCLEETNRKDEMTPEKLIPDFLKLRMWKTVKDEGDDFIWIFYDENASRLYIVESFT